MKNIERNREKGCSGQMEPLPDIYRIFNTISTFFITQTQNKKNLLFLFSPKACSLVEVCIKAKEVKN